MKKEDKRKEKGIKRNHQKPLQKRDNKPKNGTIRIKENQYEMKKKTENKNWKLYVLYDKTKIEEGVKYVGMTSRRIIVRLKAHMYQAKYYKINGWNSYPVYDWLTNMELKNIGFFEINSGLSRKEASQLEIDIINVHRCLGYQLYNLSDGGNLPTEKTIESLKRQHKKVLTEKEKEKRKLAIIKGRKKAKKNRTKRLEILLKKIINDKRQIKYERKTILARP